MKKYLLLLVINFSYSQSNYVTIVGNMKQDYGGDYVAFSKPIGKYTTTIFYVDSTDNVLLKGDKFIQKIDISGPGIIYVFEKPFNSNVSTRFFAEPGDTIFLERKNGEIIFKGKNAIVNKLYSDAKLGPVPFNDEIYDVFKNNTTSEKIIEKLVAVEKKHLKYYDSLFRKKQITKSCLVYTKTIVKQSIDQIAIGFASNQKFREEQKMLVSNEDAKKISDYINLKYIPYNKDNLSSPFFFSRIKKSALYLEEQSLKNNKKNIRFWNQFDAFFNSYTKNFGVIDYIEHEEYKETYIGQLFLGLLLDKKQRKLIDYKDLLFFYKTFADKYPDSPYIIPFSETIMEIALDKISSSTVVDIPELKPKAELGNLAIYEKNLESFDSKNFAQSNQSLLDALVEKFPNQDLFIDFWATWCGPCIKQFSYNNDLHTFLDTKNIKTLYLSVDKEKDILKWEKYINDYCLKGYHLLTNDIYSEKFIDPLGKYIPMYLLYNSKSKELKEIKGLPSEKEAFYMKINEILLTK